MQNSATHLRNDCRETAVFYIAWMLRPAYISFLLLYIGDAINFVIGRKVENVLVARKSSVSTQGLFGAMLDDCHGK